MRVPIFNVTVLLVLDKAKFQNPDWYVEEGADPLLEVYQQYDEIVGRLIGIPRTI